MLKKKIATRGKALFFIVLLLCIVFWSADVLAASDATIVSRIVNTFYEKLKTYEQVMLKYAKLLFYWCAVLEVAWLGIKSAIGASDMKDTIKNFCLVLLTAGFFLAVINNYNTWSWNIINGLKSIAGEATTLVDASDEPFTVGLELAQAVFEKVSIRNPLYIVPLVLAGFAIVVCFALIAMQIILIKCEVCVAMCASSILLGLGATSFLRDYAVNTLKYIFAVAFKLMTMQLVMGVGISFIRELKVAEEIDFVQIAVTVGFCIIFYALVKTLPDVVSGIIQGSHVSTGNSLTSTVTALGAGLAGLSMAAGSGVANIGRAAQVARAEGAQGLGGVTKGAASNLWSAARESMHNKDASKNTVATSLRERIEAARQRSSK
ncbi:P-type conjugative transfer protein TrbL [Desulfovibrio legallii]|uniref:Type IV secretion system protein TrbL n=1 Tax=Desulfovibrio legallii TaxID=571438 RepID=A0A1G7K8I4_9BACT|nr:P-type conjugative transfer protein TrbL [Desulfovibrio legallii]SDF33482.1 type IV secretion system protein TrbL [Desulfovibrio legallii]